MTFFSVLKMYTFISSYSQRLFQSPENHYPIFGFFAAGIVLEDKNWPPFFPIIHHDIANEIPIHLQKLQYVTFTTLLGM